ncbi:hypothetical protein LMG24238_04775 [Paraburkholderia sediminicola]|uniref:Uncharacterized protein n=1 Tax=Paraburkholderia sediminicola TaxID=458836 RepID=A0A6J5BWP1_9BURK|nr:hypothetical protein LMG24238_04775 [Paraburkholderia sediminicola]
MTSHICWRGMGAIQLQHKKALAPFYVCSLVPWVFVSVLLQ